MLWEDLKNADGPVIGFMVLKGQTVSTIRGRKRRLPGQYEITQYFHRDGKDMAHTVKLSDDCNTIDLTHKKVDGDNLEWTLTLQTKWSIPHELFHYLVCIQYTHFLSLSPRK